MRSMPPAIKFWLFGSNFILNDRPVVNELGKEHHLMWLNFPVSSIVHLMISLVLNFPDSSIVHLMILSNSFYKDDMEILT